MSDRKLSSFGDHIITHVSPSQDGKGWYASLDAGPYLSTLPSTPDFSSYAEIKANAINICATKIREDAAGKGKYAPHDLLVETDYHFRYYLAKYWESKERVLDQIEKGQEFHTPPPRDPTCEERIDEHLKRTLDDIRAWRKAQDKRDNTEDADEILCKCGHQQSDHNGLDSDGECLDWDDEKDEACSCKAFERAEDVTSEEDEEWGEDSNPIDALSVDKHMIVTICMSWGGPADYFDVTLDWDDERNQPGEITEIYYRFEDWFDSARRKLEGEEFDLAEDAIQHFYYLDNF